MQFDRIGADWLAEEIIDMAEAIERMSPVAFNEENRYIPPGLSPTPGFIRFSRFPFMREPLECFAPESPVREVNFMKGVQVGYTTLLESIFFFYMLHVRTAPIMFITADGELATQRMENNIIPMINESGFSDRIRSADIGNSRKTGKTKDFMQWDGGGFLIYDGAKNAAKMRQHSVPVMLKDEVDGWPRIALKNGNSDKLTDARLSAYWSVRKILRGSTPLEYPSLIHDAFLRGDQRKYMVLCIGCSFPQELRMEHINEETGVVGGFTWETENGTLILESVRYVCPNCGRDHVETDKEILFSESHGAHWAPTATPKEYGIRSYHLPSFYSPVGFRPWYKCIADYLTSYDKVKKKVIDLGSYQEFYNNVLGKPFRQPGARIQFTTVSAHRRRSYRLGEIPNEYAKENSGSPVLFLTCTVDVHKSNLAVAIFGWCLESRPYVIDYWRFKPGEDWRNKDCRDIACPVWDQMRDLIEKKTYTADDGQKYKILLTFIDSNGPANSSVLKFCGEYASGVFPILGRPRPKKVINIKEFFEFTAKDNTVGFGIYVDHYKDRLSAVLRRQWIEGQGLQDADQFNAPVDIGDDELRELTREELREETAADGSIRYYWHRPGNAPNELMDLTGYGYASVDIIAADVCIKQLELENVDWGIFWDYVRDPANDVAFGRLAC